MDIPHTEDKDMSPRPSREHIVSIIKDHIQQTIDTDRPFSSEGFPVLSHDELVPALQVLLEEYVQQGDVDRFLILFHAFKHELDTPQLSWVGGKADSAMRIGVSRAIKELHEDGLTADGELLLKVALKAGAIEQDDIARIQGMIGVSDSTGRDRL